MAKLVSFVARHAGRERSQAVRLITLFFGALIFLVALPFSLGMLGHALAPFIPLHVPKTMELPLSLAALAIGVFFLLWSVGTFWFVGKGTPFPFASPTRLVTSGPFRYTRNPIKLGAVLAYFGLGTVWDGLVTGLFMFILSLALGIIYHRRVEEQELSIRFGQEYEAYRHRTSFLIPLPPKKAELTNSTVRLGISRIGKAYTTICQRRMT